MKKLVCLFFVFLFMLNFPMAYAFLSEETVYANDFVNIRTAPDIESDIVTVLQKGSSIIRLGETDNGWSRVLYEGEERFIFSEYLSVEIYEENEASSEELTEELTEPETEDNSTPRFMVTSYELSSGCIFPDETEVLKIVFKNFSSTKALYNIKLSLYDPSGEILTLGMPTKYVNSISSDSSFTWEVELKAINTATIGQHDLQITAEYEDKNFSSYSSNDTVRIDVRQNVKLSYSGAVLPKKVIQGETQTVTVDFMNIGKSTVYNCILSFDIEGMQSGGSVFVGNIPPAMNAQGTANLRIDSTKPGKVSGKITVSYEDDYGKEYVDTVDVSTIIEEKVIRTDTSSEEKDKKKSLWWLFLLIGLAAGGAIGSGMIWFINDKKQRKEDNLRL